MRWPPILVALALVVGCASLRPPPPLEVPLHRQADGRIIVDVTVDGLGPFPFLLDTGASVTILDDALVAELGLAATGNDVTVHGVAASTRAPAFEGVEIGIGGEDLSPPWIVSLDLSHLRNARGVLGVDVLSQRVVEIDGDLEVVRLGHGPYDPPGHMIASRTDLVAESHGLPLVPAAVNDTIGLALIDTGLGGMIIVPDFADRANVPMTDGPMDLVDVLSEAASTPRSGRARLQVASARWTIQRIALLRPSVLDVVDAPAPTEAILGASVFAEVNLVIDFQRGRVFIVDQPVSDRLSTPRP